MEPTNLAVLIDFENIAAGTEKEGLGRFDVDSLMARVKDKGRILIARSYADWGRFARFKQALLAANVTMMELTSHGMQDKNRADIAMVVDTLELAFTKDYIETFVIVSGDSDFTPMVLKLRELNKRVIGCGTKASTSRLLIQACDEFFYYDSIVKKKSSPRRSNRRGNAKVPKDRAAAFDLLSDVLEGMMRENPDPPLASILKSAMQRKSPEFSESDLGFSSFGRFLEAAAKASFCTISRDRKSGGYRVYETGANGENDEDDDSVLVVEETNWDDPYLPADADAFVSALADEGLHILSAPVRKTVLEAFEASVAERKKRRRRINLQFVMQDMKKRLRRTHPDLHARYFRGLFNGLMRTGSLLHRDGNPIRSSSAPFHIEKDAEEMNESLVQTYLSVLHHSDVELSSVPVLADLCYGDAERVRDVEETLAWIAANADEDSTVDEPAEGAASDDAELDEEGVNTSVPDPFSELDLDDLLAVEGSDLFTIEDETADAPAATPAEAADSEASEAPEGEEAEAGAAPPAEAAEEPPKKKKKTVRRKKTTKAAPSEEASSDDTSAEEAPVSTTEDAPAAGDAEVLAVDEAAPKKRTRRRKRKREDEGEAPEATS